jgi:hypothetical protein
LFGYQRIRPAQEDLRWQLLALITAIRTRDHDGFEGEVFNSGWYVAVAALALDDEQLAFLESECHRGTGIGEYLAKVQR